MQRKVAKLGLEMEPKGRGNSRGIGGGKREVGREDKRRILRRTKQAKA